MTNSLACGLQGATVEGLLWLGEGSCASKAVMLHLLSARWFIPLTTGQPALQLAQSLVKLSYVPAEWLSWHSQACMNRMGSYGPNQLSLRFLERLLLFSVETGLGHFYSLNCSGYKPCPDHSSHHDVRWNLLLGSLEQPCWLHCHGTGVSEDRNWLYEGNVDSFDRCKSKAALWSN